MPFQTAERGTGTEMLIPAHLATLKQALAQALGQPEINPDNPTILIWNSNERITYLCDLLEHRTREIAHPMRTISYCADSDAYRDHCDTIEALLLDDPEATIAYANNVTAIPAFDSLATVYNQNYKPVNEFLLGINPFLSFSGLQFVMIKEDVTLQLIVEIFDAVTERYDQVAASFTEYNVIYDVFEPSQTGTQAQFVNQGTVTIPITSTEAASAIVFNI